MSPKILTFVKELTIILPMPIAVEAQKSLVSYLSLFCQALIPHSKKTKANNTGAAYMMMGGKSIPISSSIVINSGISGWKPSEYYELIKISDLSVNLKVFYRMLENFTLNKSLVCRIIPGPPDILLQTGWILIYLLLPTRNGTLLLFFYLYISTQQTR